jgi:SAM-dependent methyltransferase
VTSNEEWQTLAVDYKRARAREDSLDRLMEWDAQRELIGSVVGKDLLDVGCGNGEKAIELALNGASSVVGVDIGSAFRTPPANVTLTTGDLSELGSVAVVQGRQFDAVLFLQSLGYAADQLRTLRAARSLLRDDGVLVVSRAHPIRFAVERAERDGLELGDAYHSTEGYSYPSHWNPEITLTHATDTFSSMHNALVEAGFRVERIVEPQLSEEKKVAYPAKQAWLARYFGVVVFRARPL